MTCSVAIRISGLQEYYNVIKGNTHNRNLSTGLSDLCTGGFIGLLQILLVMITTNSELGTCPTVFCPPLSKAVPVSVESSIRGSRNASVTELIFPSLHLCGVRCVGSADTQAAGDQCSYAFKRSNSIHSDREERKYRSVQRQVWKKMKRNA